MTMNTWLELDTLSKPLAGVLALAAAALLGLSIYDVYGNIHDARAPATNAPATASPTQSQARPTERPGAKVIVDAHLFGAAPSETAVVEVTQAPETQLSLELAGVIASDDSKFSRAIISANSGGAKSYAIGETIEGTDAQLRNVEPGRVLIERRGQIESVPLIRSKIGADSRATPPDQELPALNIELPAESRETPGAITEKAAEASSDPNRAPLTPAEEAAALVPRIPF
jgi:type II secretion system protein C